MNTIFNVVITLSVIWGLMNNYTIKDKVEIFNERIMHRVEFVYWTGFFFLSFRPQNKRGICYLSEDILCLGD